MLCVMRGWHRQSHFLCMCHIGYDIVPLRNGGLKNVISSSISKLELQTKLID
jgi:hypothetical protein